MRSITFAASLLLLTGCAGALKPEQAERVTPSAAYSSGETVLNVTRDSAMQAGGADLRLTIDGNVAAVLPNGSTVALKLPAGTYTVSGFWAGPQSWQNNDSLTVTTTPAFPSFVRVYLISGKTTFTRTSEERADFKDPEAVSPPKQDKAGLITAMRLNASLADSYRRTAREMSVKYRNGRLQEALNTFSITAISKTKPLFEMLKNSSQGDERRALIRAYSLYLTVVNPSDSINTIESVRGEFNAAVNELDLM